MDNNIRIEVHYVRQPSSLAQKIEEDKFSKLNELNLDRDDPWYCPFHELRWTKMVFRP